MNRYKKNPKLNHVLVTGGAGYVGAILSFIGIFVFVASLSLDRRGRSA